MPYAALSHSRRLAAARQREPDNRPSACARGYDRRWRRVRAIYLSRHPLCERCKQHGWLRPAVDVHHIKPIADGGDVYDLGNLEALCRTCHSQETRREGHRRSLEP